MSSILVINGPNLHRLGTREPEIYGSENYDDLVASLTTWTQGRADLEIQQSDDEAEILSFIHRAIDTGQDIIINPGAFTHYSYALRDALADATSQGRRVIEVHLTNPAAREGFRRLSVISPAVTGTITGMGFDSFRLAVEALVSDTGE